MHKTFSILLLAGTSFFSAQAITIDFNSLSGNQGTSFTLNGVTFSTSGTGGLDAVADPNGTIGLLEESSPRQFIRADISGGANAVSIDLGDFDADADTIFLQVFDSGNNSLGYTSQSLDASFTGMVTLNLSAADIAYAVFGSTAPSVNGSSVFADNFTSTAISAVPDASSTCALMTAGLGTLAFVARRRKL